MSSIPSCTGDFLYAVMIYLLIRIVFINKQSFQILILALFTCYAIEFFQLYQAVWIIRLRQTLFGRYVLGQGFLWSDIIAYTFGVALTCIAEKIFLKSNINQRSA